MRERKQQNIERHAMTNTAHDKLLKELASWEHVEIIRERDYITAVYNGSMFLATFKGIDGKGRIVECESHLLSVID